MTHTTKTQRGTISHRQMMTVLFLTLFPLGTEWLVELLAPVGSPGWLCPLGAGLLVLMGMALMGRWGVGNPLDGFRPRSARIWAGIFLAWGLILTAAQTARVGSRLADSLGASPALVTAVLLVLVGWIAAGGLPAFARACEIFSLAIGGGFFFLCVMGVFRLEWDWVLLWEPGELSRLPRGVATAAGVLAAGCFGLFFKKEVTPEAGEGRKTALGLGRVSLALAAAQILVLGRLGPALTGRVRRPFFQMVSGLGFEGAFQRLEELASALWVLGDAALLVFLLLAMERLANRMTGRAGKGTAWWLTPPVFLLSLPGVFWSRVLAGEAFLWTALAAGGIMVLFSALSAKKGQHFKKIEKNEKRG